jgi:aryl-alcohol dehydrogenase-like predicted oxidoreductase
MGCMRLSTATDRDDERNVEVLHAALDAGVRLLDTADAYAWHDRDIGHNERLVAEALRTWSGDPSSVVVATKGGLKRPGGRWVPDGSAKHLRRACEASIVALDVPCLALYQLHAPDPRVSLKRSLAALAALKREGLIARIGLCNVDRDSLERALAWAEIDAVQVALSPVADEALYGGVVEFCETHNIPVLAHTPLGGPRGLRKLAREASLMGVAERHNTNAPVVALTWLRDLSAAIVPIPGASRVATARACAESFALSESDRTELDGRFRGGAWHRTGRLRRPSDDADKSVVVMMGIQGAGKSAAARAWIDSGYQRLNRDTRGGNLDDLNDKLERGLAEGQPRWVLDNTYPTRASRARVLDAAWRQGAAVHCQFLDTPLPEAQINAVRRILARYGHLPDPSDLSQLAKSDPHAFDPRAQFRFQRNLEPPSDDEGFATLERVAFERRASEHQETAILIQLEGVLRTSRRGDRAPLTEADVVVDRRRAAMLRARAADGATLLGISWQPAVATGDCTQERVQAVFAHTLELLELDIDIRHCPHAAGPPKCWCRTPLPGLAVQLIDHHRIDPARCTMIGRSAPDKTLGTRMGFDYVDHETYFGSSLQRDDD